MNIILCVPLVPLMTPSSWTKGRRQTRSQRFMLPLFRFELSHDLLQLPSRYGPLRPPLQRLFGVDGNYVFDPMTEVTTTVVGGLLNEAARKRVPKSGN